MPSSTNDEEKTHPYEKYLVENGVKEAIETILGEFYNQNVRPSNPVDMLRNFFKVSEKKELEEQISENEALKGEVELLESDIKRLEDANEKLRKQMGLHVPDAERYSGGYGGNYASGW